MGVLGGLGAALGWGIADFFAREAGQREGSLVALLYLQLVGTPTAALLLIFTEDRPWQTLYSLDGLAGFFVGLELVLGTILLYHALTLGPLLIVAPISSSYAAVTAVLSLLSGERPATTQIVGMVVTLIGVVLAAITANEESQPDPNRDRRKGLPLGVIFALGAAVAWGVGVWLVGGVVSALGSSPTVFVLRASGMASVVVFFLATNRSFLPRSRASWRWLLPIGVLDTAANLSLSIGLLSSLTSIVSVMSSLYGVVTVILGYVIAGERVTRIQQVGIVVTFIGVALVSL